MNPKIVDASSLGLDAAKVLAQARRSPVLIRVQGQPTLVLRRLVDDDEAEGLLLRSKRFRASIRRARQNRTAGRSVPLAEAKRRLSRRASRTA